MPMTVVASSLTDETRDRLGELLDPYVSGKIDDPIRLAAIFSNPDNFPRPILNELKALGKKKGSSVIYVVDNFPEIDLEKVPWKQIRDPAAWTRKHTYAAHIGKGIGEACDLATDGPSPLIRYSNTIAPPGRILHKHDEKLTSLGGVVTDGALTRFVDMRTLLDQAKDDPGVGDLPVKTHHTDRFIPLRDFERHHPDWQKLPDQDEDLEIRAKEDAAASFDALTARHSKLIEAKSGTMIFWPNDGHIFHQAMLTSLDPKKTGGPSRVALGRAYNP